MRLYKFTTPNTAYYTLANSVTDAICNYKKRHADDNAIITKYTHSQGVQYTLNNVI